MIDVRDDGEIADVLNVHESIDRSCCRDRLCRMGLAGGHSQLQWKTSASARKLS
jgi:hypothetical protein